MKRLIILLIILMGTLSYTRDFEFNEKRDVKVGMDEEIERVGRYALNIWDLEEENYSDFQRELETQYRGHEGR
ncbi:hypothetical protein PM10SUCC1_18020 [Propionigenium maris DSM 9537]|uniref:Uncharacterized protein n=1 Tax=Propionigenium maris DSM 9537 TaxID=1123000 RepID=A0A9W6GJG4_9FUSO|nr:hypothetical protein [Propionigenium maris]GLI56288.1 hypothetical protein PM10SUCC1_18020 [Propionigenium maris DSM 9537]